MEEVSRLLGLCLGPTDHHDTQSMWCSSCSYGLVVSLSSFFVFVIYLAFLTSYVLTNGVSSTETDSTSRGAAWLVVFFSAFRLIVEALQMVEEKGAYFLNFQNYVELASYGCSIVFILPIRDGEDLSIARWTAGAYAVFFGWINLIVFVGRFEYIGVYVLMFKSVLKTVVTVLCVFFVFIVGFGLCFYMLLPNQYYFQEPGRAILKTFVMMTGEFEYTDYFVSEDLEFGSMSYVIMCIFVVVMPIILMNLLVGEGTCIPS